MTDILTRPARHDLDKSAMLRVADASRLRVAVTRGTIWLTLDNDLRDIVLQPGDSFVDDRHRGALLFALRPSQVSVTAA